MGPRHIVLVAAAAATSLATAQSAYSPTVGEVHATNVYWGDMHLHTNLSPDAAAGGNRQFGHDEAYRLARGKPLPRTMACRCA